MGTVHWRKTDARYKKGFPMTVAVPTITDVVFVAGLADTGMP